MTEQHRDRDKTRRDNETDYNKMIAHEDFGTAKGSGVPERTQQAVGGGNVGSGTVPNDIEAEGSSTGGRNTTNSTVSGGGTAGGTNIGSGATRDRGTMNDAPDLSQNSNPILGTPPLRADAEAHNPVPLRHEEGGRVEKHGQIIPEKSPLDKGSSPLNPREADKINQDARNSSDVPLSKDTGHDQEAQLP